MTGKWFKYKGADGVKGEEGDVIPGVGVIGKEPIEARDDAHLAAIEDSGVYEKAAAPKKPAEPKADATDKGAEK
ncbi:hypothetical protein K7W42_20280 [Deinococcus sp. HMF7604]|uniref:hypothetical protein n=1 Tax=Deinococcus betulae TaxID=2873312 RepID=UPI001CCBC723|nr:hypothetical protein [Deinococcus betulae]MBZ9753177.1 hypothetical protein [Deinococcus betulae]